MLELSLCALVAALVPSLSFHEASSSAQPSEPPEAEAREADIDAAIDAFLAEIEAKRGPIVAALVPPSELAPDCVAYCARCQRQYVRVDSACSDCGDRPVAPYAA